MVKAKEIPRSDGYMIGAMLFDTISRYYADPRNQEKFERWQQERQERERRNDAKKGSNTVCVMHRCSDSGDFTNESRLQQARA